jgi:hypothetical protein
MEAILPALTNSRTHAESSHCQITAEFREALAEHIQEKVALKDEHFANGRMLRSEFENAMRNLANRVVTATELTPDVVSAFHPADLGQSFANNWDNCSTMGQLWPNHACTGLLATRHWFF